MRATNNFSSQSGAFQTANLNPSDIKGEEKLNTDQTAGQMKA